MELKKTQIHPNRVDLNAERHLFDRNAVFLLQFVFFSLLIRYKNEVEQSLFQVCTSEFRYGKEKKTKIKYILHVKLSFV